MDWWEVLLITIGISLDIFAAAECEGALTPRVEKKALLVITLGIVVAQAGALFVGDLLARIVYSTGRSEKRLVVFLVEMILLGIGGRMIQKAVKNERIVEHRVEKVELKRLLRTIAITGVNTLLIGVVFAFTGTNLWLILGILAIVTIAVVILGMYTGYHFGYEQKTKAYAIGGGLLFVAACDVIIKQILEAVK